MAGNREYVKLRSRYKKLPDWAWLRKNFTVKIEEDGPVIEQVRSTMADKLESVGSKIEPLISGAENFCCYFERRMLSMKEKEKMFELYKNIQFLLWKSNSLGISFSEKECAEWIAEARKFWDSNRPFIIEIFEKLSTGWKTYKKSEVSTAYHG